MVLYDLYIAFTFLAAGHMHIVKLECFLVPISFDILSNFFFHKIKYLSTRANDNVIHFCLYQRSQYNQDGSLFYQPFLLVHPPDFDKEKVYFYNKLFIMLILRWCASSPLMPINTGGGLTLALMFNLLLNT